MFIVERIVVPTLFKISRKDVETGKGIVYLLVVRLEDGTEAYKIGITTRDISDRVEEILTSIWKKLRYYPYCKPKRYRSTENYFEKEQAIHKELEEFRWDGLAKTSGGNEWFSGVSLEHVVEVYERVVC